MRLADLRKPLEEVEFLSGTKITPVPFGPPEYARWREVEHEVEKGRGHGDPQKIGDLCIEIIRACYPGLTDHDLLDCEPQMLIALAAYPGGKIEQVRAALKNAEAVEAAGAAPPPATTPSSPKTSGNTSASKSRKRSAKTSGTSTTASPTDAPSSSGIASIDSMNRSASTRSVENSMTSIAP